MDKKIGFALGGGGGRGAAHIGVLTAFERLGIRPDLITGTSIGGMLGALYAAGLDANGLADFFRQLQVDKMFALPANSFSLASNNKLAKLLEQTIGRLHFADLQIPLAVTATDIRRHKLVVLDDGDLISAVLATSALPIVLPPVERNGLVLIDGGLLNNVPFDVAYARGAMHVLAVDLTNAAEYGANGEQIPPGGVRSRILKVPKLFGTWQVLNAVMDIVTEQSLKTRLALTEPDFLIRPFLDTIGVLDFHRLEEGIAAGVTAVHEIEPQLQTLLQGEQA
ncbi:MAG: patatin-like phospholipase family protein [Chloroflexi bacterium]|jgi:NTE family protein|nr:patatin-like phospholipase family protein [Chloroflexota bacterium]MBK6710623.1 patatin-like phospholipase family protein [Chloroflexota bacterium]MBK7179062.1 patatin-like phospholipase family protein [Chloroflexota bacterium]MBK7917456.1 patatin-like phospholipase family protein [Chloroflexota bacterium]MBK8933243.1 patatin-like phospholipase family protein [Chloroflexota bacterium]